MLKLKYLFENNELAKMSLKNWDYDTENLERMLQYFRISSNAIYHWYAMDVLIAMDSLSEELEGERLKTAKACFLQGYQGEYSSLDEMMLYFPLFQRFIDLYSYTRTLRITKEQWKNEPEWLSN